MKTILITGAAGLIGSTLINKIKNNQNIIIAIDDLSGGNIDFLKTLIFKRKIIFINEDVSKKKFNKKFTNKIKNFKFDEVWLLAANSDIQKGVLDSHVDFKNTYLTTFNFLNNIEKNLKKNCKIIFTSSSAIYGENKNKNLLKENNGPFTPVSNYGSMKLASEAYITHFAHKKKLIYQIYRLPNVIGENITHGIFYDMRKKFLNSKKIVKVLGNGNQKKPYMYCKDIIEIFLNNKKNKSSIMNIGQNDNGITVKQIVNLFKKHLKSKKKISFGKTKYGWIGDVPKYKLNNSLIKKYNLFPKYFSSSLISAKKTIKDIL